MNGLAPWAWRELDATEARASWDALSRFVDWLVARYDLADLVPRCWFAHGAIVEELTALWAAWTASYLDPDASPDAPITWHERFAQCRVRIGEWDRLGCAQRGHRDDVSEEWGFDAERFASFVDADVAKRPGAQRVGRIADSSEPTGVDDSPPDPEGPSC